MKPAWLSSIVIDRDDVNAIISRYQFNRSTIELNICFCLLKQVLDQASVAFRPRDQRLRLGLGAGAREQK
jgi:hypothetical protein